MGRTVVAPGGFPPVAGMVAVITAVLAGSAGGLLAAVAFGHSLVAALVAGVVAAAALIGLMRYQNSAWIRGSRTSLAPGADELIQSATVGNDDLGADERRRTCPRSYNDLVSACKRCAPGKLCLLRFC
jgi:hypothetical protein